MKNLEYIIAIAEEQSLLRAAERLFVSSSALSQFVLKLEAELQTPLFVRSRSGWTPTAAGHLYLDMAKKIQEMERRTHAEIGAISQSFATSVSIGITAGRMPHMIAACFPAFNARFPNIKLTLEEGNVWNIVKAIKNQTVDLGFLTSAFDFNEVREIRTQILKTEDFVVAVPAGHPLVRNVVNAREEAPLLLEYFRDLEFMLMQRGTTLREAEDQLFSNAGFEPKVIFESASAQARHVLAQSGYAAAILPHSYVVPTEKAVYFRLESPMQWRHYAAYHVGHELSVPEKHMIALAEEYYKERD